MRATALLNLRCSTCKNGVLNLDEAKLPIISSDAAYGQEIKEGFLHCSTCETTYPVIAGVAVLVQNPLTYIANNYSTIFGLASGLISSAMLDYWYGNAVDLSGNLISQTGSESLPGMSRYIFAHYEELATALSTAYPLRLLADANYGNWYGQLLQLAKPHLPSQGRSLDIGCSIGGLVYRLAPLSQFVYGLDYSFCAVLTARRIFLAQPDTQNTYRLHIEGSVYQERTLSLKKPNNVEFVVASSTSIPFEPESFDI